MPEITQTGLDADGNVVKLYRAQSQELWPVVLALMHRTDFVAAARARFPGVHVSDAVASLTWETLAPERNRSAIPSGLTTAEMVEHVMELFNA